MTQNNKNQQEAIERMVKNWEFAQLKKFNEKKEDKAFGSCMEDTNCTCGLTCKYTLMEEAEASRSIMDYFRIIEPDQQLEMFPGQGDEITMTTTAIAMPSKEDGDYILQPHLCPVCNGTKKVPYDFYDKFGPNNKESSFLPVECQTCEGEGVLWG